MTKKVFIEKEWITGNTCLFKVQDQVRPIEFAVIKGQLTKIRKGIVERLINEGYEITTDNKDMDNTICFIMNYQSIPECYDIRTYKKEFDRRMKSSSPDTIHIPHSMDFIDYLNNPFYPAVLKNENMNAGLDKFFIENEEQVIILKKLYEDLKDKPEYKNIFDSCIFQQYIKNPNHYKSYLRVLMGASGEVMGASLKYTKSQTINKKEIITPLEKLLLLPNSPYYLNCQTMFNYYASEANSISLFQPKYGTLSSEVLQNHNIDSSNPQIPEDVLISCQNMMKYCNQELGIICGFDFIYNDLDQTWYYLENQAFPAIDEWLVKNGKKPFVSRNIKEMMKLFTLEAEARIEALHSYSLSIDMKEKPETLKKQL